MEDFVGLFLENECDCNQGFDRLHGHQAACFVEHHGELMGWDVERLIVDEVLEDEQL